MNAPYTPNPPSFLSRVALSIAAFVAILGDAAFAARYQAWRSGPVTPPAPPPTPPTPALLKTTSPEDVYKRQGQGWTEVTAGPPVLKRKLALPVSSPTNGFQPRCASTLHAVPGGSS